MKVAQIVLLVFIGFFLLVDSVMVYNVLPKFAGFYSHYGSELPKLTEAVLVISHYWHFMIIAVLAGSALLFLFNKKMKVNAVIYSVLASLLLLFPFIAALAIFLPIWNMSSIIGK